MEKPTFILGNVARCFGHIGAAHEAVTAGLEEFRLYATEVMGLPAPANRSGLIEPTRSFAIAAQQGGAA